MRYSDHILILKIRSGKRREETEALCQIREQSFEMICGWICRNNGTRTDAEGVFQEVSINLVQKIRSGKYQHKAALRTYNFSVAQRNWLKKLRKKGHHNISLEDYTNTFESPINIEEDLMIKERNTMVRRYLNMLSGREQEILKLYYFERKKMSEIAEIMRFKSEQVAKNTKCKAMKKLRELMCKRTDILYLY